MKGSSFTETQIISILKENEAGTPAKDICRKHGISDSTFYKWKTRYFGMGEREVKKMREMESQLSRLKRMYADIALENFALKDFIGNKLDGHSKQDYYTFNHQASTANSNRQ
jgi:putative transposase